jgi:hypothetical protein
MKNHPCLHTLCLPWLFAIALVLLPGCSLKKAYPAKSTFALEAIRGEATVRGSSAVVLRVRPFNAVAPFDERVFRSRIDDVRFEADFYNEFIFTPRTLISDQTRLWLQNAGLFGAVLEPASRAEPTHSLEGSVTALYADLRDAAAPKAVMELRLLLLKDSSASPEIVLDKTYRQAVPLENRQPATLAAGWSKGLAQILTALEQDLAAKLAASR